MNKDKPMDLARLFADYLRQRVAGAQAGVATETAGEIELFQAASFYPVDTRLAWSQATEAAAHLLPKSEANSFAPARLRIPEAWPNLVREQASLVAIPFCLANYPQMMRTVTPLLSGTPLPDLRPRRNKTPAKPETSNETKSKPAPDMLLMAALERVQGSHETAATLLAAARQKAPHSWAGLILNEEAALTWHSGDVDRAEQLWNNHPDQQSPVIAFNRGLCRLFAGQTDAAAPLLSQAAAGLASESPWHDLAELYRSLVNVLRG